MRWVLPLLALMTLSPTLRGSTIPIGLVSWDTFIPGINTLNILNLTGDPSTGGFALPPDFPVIDSLTLLNISVTLLEGSSTLVFPLGDLSPGALSPMSEIQFSELTFFSSALITGSLSQTTFQRWDGSTFFANSPTFTVTLLPSGGTALVAGVDFAMISVSNDSSGVPEPNSSLTVLCGLCVLSLGIYRRRRRSI